MTYPQLWYLQHSLKRLWALPVRLSPISAPGNHPSFTVSIVLPSPECHLVGIKQYILKIVLIPTLENQLLAGNIMCGGSKGSLAVITIILHTHTFMYTYDFT